MSKKIATKININNNKNKTNDNSNQTSNDQNQNITIEVKNFNQIEDYCCNGYQEHFDKISGKSLENYKLSILAKVLNNDDPDMLKYIVGKVKFSPDDVVEKFRFQCKNSKNFKEIIRIIIDCDTKIKDILLSDIYFKKFIADNNLNLIKEIHRLRQENSIQKIKLNLSDVSVSNYSNLDIFFWLIDEDFFGIEKNNINVKTNQRIVIKILREYLRSYNVELNKFKTLIEKLNFNFTDLGEIFNKNNPCQTGFSYILEELINRNKEELIYYLFEHIKPENIINPDKKITYIKNLIYANNYSLFMFIMEKMQSIKLLADFTYYDSSNIMDSISDSENTDYKIIYELLKLDIEPKRGTKLYELYRMIKFSNKHYYY